MRYPSFSVLLFVLVAIAARIERSSPVLPASGGEASAERTHVVQVGKDGLFVFSPNNLSAQAGDSVLFEISDPTSHTVSQSGSLTQPCALAESRFSTALGDLTFLLQTSPIFVHCELHCSEGMVMIINPESALDVAEMEIIARDWNRTAPPSGEDSSTDIPKKTDSPGETRGPAGHPGEGMRKDVAAALATALALAAAAVTGACYMLRRRMKRRARALEREDGEAALTPFRPQSGENLPERKRVIMAAAPSEDDGPGEGKTFEQRGAAAQSHRPFGSGNRNPMFAPGSPGDGEDVIGSKEVGVEPTPSVTFLQAELDRVLAENERLRQTADPPAYSDGARSELRA